jgi:glycosyltransferase involved in cell wall biosynthesis
MNILISAYACEPHKGSEPGVGWNLSIALSAKHNIFVLTRRNNKNAIEKVLTELPNSNIHFIYYDLPSGLMRLKKISGTQIYYILWQLLAYYRVRNIVKKEKIDLIHHITFNQYRTLSFGFFFNIPFVFGPVGGAELINKVFYTELNTSTRRRENFRQKGKGIKLFSFLSKYTPSPKVFLFSANENKERLEKYIMSSNYIIEVFPAIGIDTKDFYSYKRIGRQNNNFTLIYAGRADDWKGIHIFLDALQIYKSNGFLFEVKLIGIRSEEERYKVSNWVNQFGLNAYIEIIDFMSRIELINQLSSADLFVYPAFRDSGSMAVLESCALGCPTICFDAGGQDVFPNDIILKVPISAESYIKTRDQFANKLVWAYNNRCIINEIGIKAQKFVNENFTWKIKAERIDAIYKKILNDV